MNKIHNIIRIQFKYVFLFLLLKLGAFTTIFNLFNHHERRKPVNFGIYILPFNLST